VRARVCVAGESECGGKFFALSPPMQNHPLLRNTLRQRKEQLTGYGNIDSTPFFADAGISTSPMAS
jgi:hypothetical protein